MAQSAVVALALVSRGAGEGDESNPRRSPPKRTAIISTYEVVGVLTTWTSWSFGASFDYTKELMGYGEIKARKKHVKT